MATLATRLNARVHHKISIKKVKTVPIDKSISQTIISTAFANIWYRKIDHIQPLRLYKLGKKCLKVYLKGKNMSQCIHCALSKITQQISRCLPPNKLF